MVKHVRILIMALFAWGMTLTSVFAEVKFIPQQVMLGEPVTWIIKGSNIESDFAKLDLSQIKAHFKVYGIEGGGDSMRILLYPLKSGQFKIPAIQQGLIRSAEQTIIVRPNPEVSIDWLPLQSHVLQNEVAYWRCQVTVTNPAFEVSQVLPEVTKRYHWLAKQQPTQTEVLETGKRVTLQQAIWREKLGQLTVASPIIRIKNDTNRRWLFFSSDVKIKVSALPSFMPVTMPIGRINGQAKPIDWFVVTGKLEQRSWTLTGESLLPSHLPNLVLQLSVNPSLEWLLSESKSKQYWTKQGLESQLHTALPYRVIHSGLVYWPDLNWTYLNPSTGKLETQKITGGWQVALPWWLLALLGTLVTLVSLAGLYLLGQAMQQTWHKYKLLKRLQQAQTAQQIWQAVAQWSVYQPSCQCTHTEACLQKSFRQWQACLTEKPVQQGLDAFVSCLNQHFYSESEADFAKLKTLSQAWAEGLPIWVIQSIFRTSIKTF